MVLCEALLHNPAAKIALLDLRAAYDLVNRERLWTLLQYKYGFSAQTVARLQDLFDENSSTLLVAGKQSHPAANRRGLLQGSSLSPILFNFYINDLAEALDAKPEGLRVHGKVVNALLFADDTALLAATTPQLAKLLRTCEQWSISAGMEFSPTKCFCFAPSIPRRPTPLQLYQVDLPSTEKATYLGYPFTPAGINFVTLCEERTRTARGVAMAMRPLGMNVTGWAPAASALIYKSFVRPIMEYGVDIKFPTPGLLLKYQKAQNLALRAILSAPPHTSANAMHRILGIPLFRDRAQALNFQFTHRMHNHNDASIRGLDIWRRGLSPLQRPHPSSLPRLAMTNPLVSQYSTAFPPRSHRALVRENPTLAPFPIPPREWIHLRTTALASAHGDTDVAAAIRVRSDGRAHHYLTSQARISRPDRVTISRWQLGLVAHHQHCKGCGLALSRQHALECSGVIFEVDQLASEIAEQGRYGPTGLDILLNDGMRGGFTAERTKRLVLNIGWIESRCKGSTRTKNGFWVTPEGQ